MFSKINSFSTKLLNIAIAFSLAAMSLSVFGNVVLRYVFNSGLTWSEEMSRYLFVWMVFLGAIAALKDKMHLGVDIVVNSLPKGLQKAAFLISNAVVLYLLWLVLEGSWKMTLLNMNSTGPATGMPLSYLYGIGIVSSIWMMILIIASLFKAIRGKSESLTIIQSPDDVLSDNHPDQEDKIIAK
ncbi:TRAP-type C4-dicarboxylate transport system permease small subunit [Cytobacillus firmus]|uniref:TRAP-type C4-dicarboxylate transport system permease small subunit n=2 Tax=Cytobacillus TaxID=2675230 RepID=A0A366JSC3_CYTFI|nr:MULTISPECIES: TRAP transporter small permease [Cytobacillus]RBP91480.1 TRAP-type C4-dicarboxylate transport system permease small subunit [Cytobacillus firmus]TDX41680.1 TRAP-type C4-dicarboxylate transport system permease small subunit [Cytobacillus oceanisediminis]